ncbi:HAD-like domain-containing protein [Cadophora sp. MPI-SDFR-AT-0126]|nr:HAD-like domain-containing protein [Leotiomycetes sp. MPI-SDFR-AT-0126]
MRRCVFRHKNGLFRSDIELTAAGFGQPLRYLPAREYHSRQQLSSPTPPRCTRHQRPKVLRSGSAIVSRRSLITDAIIENHIAASETPTFAFAFDIDGVLLRSAKPLPGATEALLHLQKNNIPFILLTNGGGKLESERVSQLSKKLGVPLSEDNFVQSHTPFKLVVESLSQRRGKSLEDTTVLVTGGDGDKCRQVAESYGFRNVVIPGDILTACPEIWPFSKIFSDSYKAAARPLPRPIDPTNPEKSLQIDAIFVFNDPRDWALDTQIIIDLLMSKNGVLGTVSEKNGNESLPNLGYQQDMQPKLYFSNPDLLWAAAYHMPRLGQGGFQAALAGVWNQVTRAKLKRTVIGKPHAATYTYAETVLLKHRKKMLDELLSRETGKKKNGAGKLSRVFMVGDNPASDIKGANDFNSPIGTSWTSILVKTGVFEDGTEPEFKPKVIVDNVLDAVKWALEQEGWKDNVEKVES